MIQIFLKEINGFLDSLIGYVVIGAFLVVVSLLTWVFRETSVLDGGYANLDALFSFGPYVFIFLVPAVTMRSFAEERKLGTLELLMSKPLTGGDILTGKFLAAFLLVIISLVPTIIYYITVYQLGSPTGNIDTPGVMGSFLGMILLGGVFCSVGILASSVTTSQVVSFVLAAFLCFVLYAGFDSASALVESGSVSLAVRQAGILYHYESISKGLIDSRDLVYFITVVFIMLLSTKTVLSSRSW